LKVSVITTVLNAQETLGDAFDSLWAQSHDEVEHVVIDGGSTDGTLELCRKFNGRIDYFNSEPDDGLYDAFNKGVQAATGDLIGFLHADDLFADSDVLSDLIDCLEQHQANVVYADLLYVDRSNPGRVIRNWKSGAFEDRRLTWGWMPPHPTVFVKRDHFMKVGLFDTRYRIAGDYDHLLRVLKHADTKVAYLPRVVTKMRVGGVSNRSFNNLKRKSLEDLQIIRQHLGGYSPLTLLAKNVRKLPQFLFRG